MILAYLAIYLKQLKIDDLLIGFVISIFSITMLLTLFPFGVLSDKYSPKRIMQVGIIFLAFYILGMIITSNTLYLCFFIFLGGIGEVLFFISIHSLYYKYLGNTWTGKKIGAFITASLFGFAFGPLLGGFIYKWFGIDMLFSIALLLISILFIFSFKLVDSKPIRFTLSEYKYDLKTGKSIFLILTIFLISLHFGVEKINIGLFMKNYLNIDLEKIGILYAIVGVWMGAVTYIAGYLIDRKKNIVLLLSVGLILSGFFQSIIPLTFNWTSFLSIRLLHTIGDALVLLTQGVLVSIIFPDERVGGDFGFSQVFRTLGIFIGAVLTGILNRYYGYGMAFIISGIIMTLAGIIFLLGKNKIENSLRVNPH